MPPPTFTVHSPETGTEYHVYVQSPAAKHNEEPVGAVLFLDGDDQFAAAIEGYGEAVQRQSMPSLLLVGVGYGASYTKPGNRRARDYTPTASAMEASSGGADAFLRFLSQTLWIELCRRYPVRQDVRGLAGHSLGSLCVVHAMLQQPLFFNRLLASAPSLWWDDKAILCATERRQRAGLSIPARLYLSVGDADTPSMTTDLEQFEAQLAAQPFPELQVISQRFPGRDHYNVLTDAFRDGLIALFGHQPAR